MTAKDVKKILSVIISISLYFFGGMAYSQHGPFFPTEALEKGSSRLWIGLITGCFDICCIVTSLLVANLVNVRYSKWMFLGGALGRTEVKLSRLQSEKSNRSNFLAGIKCCIPKEETNFVFFSCRFCDAN